jgi:uncharacterized membrane protein
MSDVITGTKPAFATGGGQGPLNPGSRVISVDFMRGLAMVVMGIDHTRDYLTNVPFQPENLAHTYPALFFTRWITHFCAPLFFFLAGTGAYLLRRKTNSVGTVSRFLWTRGLWLVLLEFTIIEYAWTFVFWQMGGVIWSLGCCMVLLGFLVWLPDKLLLAFGLVLVVLHDLFDQVQASQLQSFGPLWVILHAKGALPHTHFFVLFPLVPLLGVMALGYIFGKFFDKPPALRSRLMLYLGLVTTGAFIVLRAFNTYGNPPHGVARNSPGQWHVQSTWAMTAVSFLDLEKYPASVQYLLMTLGPALILFSIVERVSGSKRFEWWSKPIVVFGRVPLLFYILHLYAIHLAAIVLAVIFHQPVGWLWKGAFWMNETPAGYGHGLPLIYLTWCAIALILYFPCAWFAEYRSRHKKWWLSYL